MAVGGPAGVLTGGVMTDRLTRRGVIDAPPRVVIGSLLIQSTLFPLAYLVRDDGTAEGLFAAGVDFIALPGGRAGGPLAVLAPEPLARVALVRYFLAANLIR